MIKKNKQKKIIFRADGNSKIGLGHLYRLFALAEMYKGKYECMFLTNIYSILSVFPTCYEIVVIPKEININDEPKWIFNFFKSNNYLIVVDGYQFDINYQIKIKKNGFKLLFIDDYANEMSLADVIVNHSLSVYNSDYKSSKQAKLGLGSKYAILRPQFLEEAKKYKKVSKVNKAFICFGGADFNNLTNTCLKGIVNIEELEEIHVVIGNAYKQNEIYKTIEENQEKISLHKNLNEAEMVKLMSSCDLAIIPTSTISYEACAVKMIILGGYYIDNQINIYKGLINNGLIYDAGNFNTLKEEDFEDKVYDILNKNRESHQKLFYNQKELFDGKQKNRFLELTKELLC